MPRTVRSSERFSSYLPPAHDRLTFTAPRAMDDAIRERALEEGRGLGDVIRVLIVLGAARLKQPLEITPRRN